MEKFKESLIEEISHTELDLQYPFYSEDERNDIDTSGMPNVWSDTVSIDIETVINSLNELKEKGANRVYIVAHEDHIGYYFTGVKLEKV